MNGEKKFLHLHCKGAGMKLDLTAKLQWRRDFSPQNRGENALESVPETASSGNNYANFAKTTGALEIAEKGSSGPPS